MSAETDLEELCRVLRQAMHSSLFDPHEAIREALDLAEGLRGRVHVDDARFASRAVQCCACGKGRLGNAPGWTFRHFGMSVEVMGSGVTTDMGSITRWLCPACVSWPTEV